MTGGVEVDFIVERRTRLLPIKVKTASRPRGADCAGVERFLTQYRGAWSCTRCNAIRGAAPTDVT